LLILAVWRRLGRHSEGAERKGRENGQLTGNNVDEIRRSLEEMRLTALRPLRPYSLA
jgi:hypothetical protein